MRMSLNCLLLGENSDKSFLVDIGKEIIVINGRNNTKIRDIKISHIKYLVFCQMNDENIKPDVLVLWKVDKKFEEKKIIREAIHIIVQMLEAAVSVDREQKRLKVVSFKMVLEEFDKNILVNKSQKLYPGFTVNIVGHFSKAIFVDCGIASLKSDDENKKFWMVKEPLAI
ncbi:hypothetical protein RhiirA1_443667 [Rhizophagus irregularis]|uniref:Uncharacterized protein n=1 Tax=Rhizophagus irregularis TaxID=588596 RepID=A0A2N0RHY6_9GLOM|nr:hypothetical protein RhiirA1_443667 [Rhizophagus irregularis]